MRFDSFARYACFGLLLTAVSALIAGGESPKISITKIRSKAPAKTARIINHYVDKPSPDSGQETGNLHIVYSDNTEVIETLRPKDKSTGEYPEGIEVVKVAPDKRAIGWVVTYDNCCNSYSIPMVLGIYRSRDTIVHIVQGQMVWYWAFRDGGKHVAAVWGTTHGPRIGDYQLYDVRTGRMISEVFGDPETQALRADAPEWAKETESQMNKPVTK